MILHTVETHSYLEKIVKFKTGAEILSLVLDNERIKVYYEEKNN